MKEETIVTYTTYQSVYWSQQSYPCTCTIGKGHEFTGWWKVTDGDVLFQIRQETTHTEEKFRWFRKNLIIITSGHINRWIGEEEIHITHVFNCGVNDE